METQLKHYLKAEFRKYLKLDKQVRQHPYGEPLHKLRVCTRRLRAALRLAGIRSSLKKVGCVLGKEREIDVALQDARKLGLKAEEVKCEQGAAQKSILQLLKSKAHRNEIRKLKKEISKVNKIQDLHRLRIDLKKARYLLEVLGQPVESLKRLQDCLGRIHDMEVLQNLSGRNKKAREKKRALCREFNRRLQN